MKLIKQILRATGLIEVIRSARRFRLAVEETRIAKNISPDIMKVFRFISENPRSAKYRGVEKHFSYGDIKFVAKKENWYGVREVLINREYSFLKLAVGETEAPLILDMGANIGAFAIFAFSLCGKAEIHSYEPSAATFSLLEKNRAMNPGLNWTARQAAVWRENATLEFETCAYSTGSKVSQSGGAGFEKVAAVGLDTILKEHIKGRASLAKMDIEGAEEKVVVAHIELIKEKIENLIIEIHPQECDAAKVVSALRSVYANMYEVSGRKSKWPLLLATNKTLPLPEYGRQSGDARTPYSVTERDSSFQELRML